MYYGSGTADGIASGLPASKYDIISEIRLRQSMHIYLPRNISFRSNLKRQSL